MTDIKKIISSLIENEININVYDYIKEIDDPTKGDYAFPCFSLSKEMHKSPVDIANELVYDEDGKYIGFTTSNI